MPGRVVDGMDLVAVHQAAEEAVERARRGEGPTLLECKTYRYMGHSRFEKAAYRSKQEVEEWMKRDPIPRFRKHLLDVLGVPEKRVKSIEGEVDKEIDDAVRFAEDSPDPNPEDYRSYLYASGGA
jgi:TPP-dependent pyruvate/acetoin dehydrogenase alpha subunit